MTLRDRVRPVTARLDLLVLGFFVVLGAGYALLPAGRAQLLGHAVVAVLCALVLLVAVAASPARRAWLGPTAAQLLFAAAEVEGVRLRWNGTDPFPSAADGLFLLGSLVLFVAVLVLVPAPRGGVRRGPALDTLVVTVSVGILVVIYTVLPAWAAPEPVLTRLVTAAYPVRDIAVVLLLVRPSGWRSARPRAFQLLATGLAATVVADVAVNVLAAEGSAGSPRWTGLLVLASYAGVAAAVCGPSAVELGHPPVERRSATPPARLPLLAVAALLPPVVLVVEHVRERFTGGAPDHGLALGIATLLVLGLVLARVRDLLRVVHEQADVVARLADTDPLTGLPNRRAWEGEVARVFAAGFADQQEAPITVAIVDLDHFKRFNDTFGHEGGDDLLVTVARCWSEALPGVFIARWGGEEFTLLLPGVGAAAATARLRVVHESVPRGQTCSIGVATWNGAEVPPAVLARADAALYRAKRTGRNRTVVAGGRETAEVDVLPGVG